MAITTYPLRAKDLQVASRTTPLSYTEIAKQTLQEQAGLKNLFSVVATAYKWTEELTALRNGASLAKTPVTLWSAVGSLAQTGKNLLVIGDLPERVESIAASWSNLFRGQSWVDVGNSLAEMGKIVFPITDLLSLFAPFELLTQARKVCTLASVVIGGPLSVEWVLQEALTLHKLDLVDKKKLNRQLNGMSDEEIEQRKFYTQLQLGEAVSSALYSVMGIAAAIWGGSPVLIPWLTLSASTLGLGCKVCAYFYKKHCGLLDKKESAYLTRTLRVEKRS